MVGRPPALGVGRGPGLVWSCTGHVAARARQYGAVGHQRGARVVAMGTEGLVGQLSSAYLLLNWASSGVLLFGTVLAVPALVRLVAVPSPALGRLATLWPFQLLVGAGYLLALLPLAALLNYWATGGLMPPRARASMYLLFLLGWFAVVLAGLLAARTAAWWPVLVAYPGRWPVPAAGLLWAGLLLNLTTDTTNAWPTVTWAGPATAPYWPTATGWAAPLSATMPSHAPAIAYCARHQLTVSRR